MNCDARFGRDTDTTLENFLRPEALLFDGVLCIGGRQRGHFETRARRSLLWSATRTTLNEGPGRPSPF